MAVLVVLKSVSPIFVLLFLKYKLPEELRPSRNLRSSHSFLRIRRTELLKFPVMLSPNHE